MIDPIEVLNPTIDGALVGSVERRLAPTGGSVPAGARSVLVRSVVTGAGSPGSVVLGPCGGAAGPAVHIDVMPGAPRSAVSVVALAAGSFCATSSVTVTARLDIVGWAGADGGAMLTQLQPRSVYASPGARLYPGQFISVDVGGPVGDAGGASAVLVAVTVSGPFLAGTLDIGACGGELWSAPFAGAVATAFTAIVPLARSGGPGPHSICLSPTTAAAVSVVVTAVVGPAG